MTAARMDFSGQGGPGPGEYDAFRELDTQYENLNIPATGTRPFESKIPRYHEEIAKSQEKKVKHLLLRCSLEVSLKSCQF